MPSLLEAFMQIRQTGLLCLTKTLCAAIFSWSSSAVKLHSARKENLDNFLINFHYCPIKNLTKIYNPNDNAVASIFGKG
jgi:hypothetical protein